MIRISAAPLSSFHLALSRASPLSSSSIGTTSFRGTSYDEFNHGGDTAFSSLFLFFLSIFPQGQFSLNQGQFSLNHPHNYRSVNLKFSLLKDAESYITAWVHRRCYFKVQCKLNPGDLCLLHGNAFLLLCCRRAAC